MADIDTDRLVKLRALLDGGRWYDATDLLYQWTKTGVINRTTFRAMMDETTGRV